MTSRRRNLLLAFAVLGLGASIASTWVHYRLLTEPAYSSVCDISSTVSCSQAYLSRYGSFWGVPVAVGGVLYFAVVLLMTAFGSRPASKTRENVPAYIFALSTIALAFVLYLAWASFFQLKAVCLLCVTTYVAVIAIFIISGGGTKLPMTTLPRRALRDAGGLAKSPVALLITVLLVGGAAALISMFPGEAVSATEFAEAPPPQYPPLTDQQRADFERWWDVQPKVDVPVDRGSAKVLVVKFNDFQCPPCRATYNEYRGILAKYTATGDVKYVLKHFPLDPECNPPGAGHFAACEASAAYVLAKPQGTSEKLEAWLFANQPSLTPELVKQGAAQAGGIADFDAQYAGALGEVRSDVAMGQKLGVKSTPTFFINGRMVGGLTGQAFEAAIELELKRNR
jgi:uncharacterized membrane protein/protein-disulfide isomerase